ncbi:MAG: glycosyl hydrolase family 18 protein [Clostridia bacterium]|nr:glycosyl hydrolase family 18 protein [Clostridia bacterium]
MKSKMIKKIIVFIMLLAMVNSTIWTVQASQGRNDEGRVPRSIVGTFLEWSVYTAHNNYAPADIPWKKLTHINYDFAVIKNGRASIFDDWAATGISFGEAWDSPFKGTFGQFKKLKAQNPYVKVLITVGQSIQYNGFHNAALTEESRNVFADSCVEFIRKYGFDGVNLDWEYPCVPKDYGGTPVDCGSGVDCIEISAGPEDKHNYTLLLQKVREKLDTASLKDSKQYVLTAEAPAHYNFIALQEPDLFYPYLDFINVSTYGYHESVKGNSVTGHSAPLYANPDEPQWGGTPLSNGKLNIDWAINEYRRLGVPTFKLNLGVQFYSYGWSGVESGVNPSQPGLFMPATGSPKGIWDGMAQKGCNPFYFIKANMETNPAYKKYRDDRSGGVPYLYSESLKEFYSYEDETSILLKKNYAFNNKGLGGMTVYPLSADYPSKGSTLVDIICWGEISPTPLPTITPFPTVTPTPARLEAIGYFAPDFDYAAASEKVLSGFEVGVTDGIHDAVWFAKTDSEGRFKVSLPPGYPPYSFTVRKANYLTRYFSLNQNTASEAVVSTKESPIDLWAGDMSINGLQDHAINMADIVEHIKYFNSSAGEGKYSADADFNQDGAINMTDILIIVKNFNKSGSDYPKIIS